MTSDEFLRYALGEIAAEAPFELRRSEQVWARYRRARRRTAAVTAGVAVAVASVTLLLLPSGGEPHGLVTRPTESPTPGASSPSPSAAAELAGAPSGDPTATAAPAAPDDAPTASATARPRPTEPAAGVLAYAPAHAHPGDTISVSLYPFAWDNGLESYTIDWGDGSPPLTVRPAYCYRVRGRYAPGHQLAEQDHKYAVSGDFGGTVTVHFGGCGPAPQVRTTFRVRVDNEPFGLPGMSAMQVLVKRTDMRNGARERALAAEVTAQDPDSYFAMLFLDWGDGTFTMLSEGLPGSCPNAHSPVDTDGPAYVEHTYPEHGSYDVYVVGQTATCDGAKEQGGYNSTVMTV